MKRLIVVVLFCLAGTCAAADEPLAFKGLALGASEKETLALYPFLLCDGKPEHRRCHAIRKYITERARQPGESSTAADIRLSRIMSVAGFLISHIGFDFYDDKLGGVSLTVSSRVFPEIVIAYTDRYGRPTTDDASPVTTRAGAVLEDRRIVWRFADGLIALTKYSANIDESRITYLSNEGLKRFEDEQRDRRSRAAKDL